jgi:hypothetical protein
MRKSIQTPRKVKSSPAPPESSAPPPDNSEPAASEETLPPPEFIESENGTCLAPIKGEDGTWHMVPVYKVPRYMMKKGKVGYKPFAQPSKKTERKMEASELIDAIINVAKNIGSHPGTGQYFYRVAPGEFVSPFSHLFPRQLVALLPDSDPKKETYAAIEAEHKSNRKGKSSRAKIEVYWPTVDHSTNRYMKHPLEIVGLLMRSIIDGDAEFFDEMASQIRERKNPGQKAIKSGDVNIKAGRVYGKSPEFMGRGGDADWFTRMRKPAREGKVPYAIWEFCRKQYLQRGSPPTRRDIRQYLASNGYETQNLRATLYRMHLLWLDEGSRPKRSI